MWGVCVGGGGGAVVSHCSTSQCPNPSLGNPDDIFCFENKISKYKKWKFTGLWQNRASC